MPSDLEKFLQQAAERLADKVGQAGAGRRPPAKKPPPRVAHPRTTAPANRPAQAEILDAGIVDASAGPDPLSKLDTRHIQTSTSQRPALATYISTADERMTSHVQHAVGHDVVELRDASKAVDAHISSEYHDTKKAARVNKIVSLLRQPDTLRAVVLANEIFNRRKW